MPDSSPFIVFRTPKLTQAAAEKPQPYDRALEVVAAAHDLASKATARFYVKDRLDRASTQLVFELGQAQQATASTRWRHYRAAQNHAEVVATVLDILRAQKAAPLEEIARAHTLVRELIADLAPFTNG